MKIAIMTTGGVGGYFGARLAAAGEDVHFIARGAHLETLREKDFSRFTSVGREGEFVSAGPQARPKVLRIFDQARPARHRDCCQSRPVLRHAGARPSAHKQDGDRGIKKTSTPARRKEPRPCLF
jgi:hypothetical protein